MEKAVCGLTQKDPETRTPEGPLAPWVNTFLNCITERGRDCNSLMLFSVYNTNTHLKYLCHIHSLKSFLLWRCTRVHTTVYWAWTWLWQQVSSEETHTGMSRGLYLWNISKSSLFTFCVKHTRKEAITCELDVCLFVFTSTAISPLNTVRLLGCVRL